MIFLFLLFLGLYIFIIGSISIGWFLNKQIKNAIPNSKKVSIIVAVRNEENAIIQLLYSLCSQTYSNFEIIIIDDHSIDQTNNLITDFIKNNKNEISILCFKLNDTECGKKAALRMAISKASGEIICTTDADCIPHIHWVTTMVYYLESGYSLVSGPVIFKKSDSFLEKIFTLEFLSLIGSGAGAIGIKKPIFCNGANMCFRKSDLIPNQDTVDYYTSGDDVFLLHKFKHEKKLICFAKSHNAIVETYAPTSIKEFLAQRLRWASKSKGYRDFDSIFVSIVVFLINCSIPIIACISLFYSQYITVFIEIIVIKLAVDMLILIPTTHFFKTKKLLLFALPLLILYPLYILSIGFFSFFMPFSWKGRKYIK